MAEVGPLSVKNEDVLQRALRVVGRVGNRFIARTVRPRLSDGQSWVDLVKLRDDERHKIPRPEDPAAVLRALADAEYLPGLLAGPNTVTLRPIAKRLQQIRNDVAHHRVVFTVDRTREELRKVRQLVHGLGGDANDINELDRLDGNLGGHYRQGNAYPNAALAPASAETSAIVQPRQAGVTATPLPPASSQGAIALIQCKSCDTEVARRAVLCPTCGKNPRQAPPLPIPKQAPPPAPANDDASVVDHSAPPTVMVEPNSAPPARTTLTLPDHTEVEVEVGQRLIIGRESPNQQVARAFASFEDVSRTHVRFVNDAQGPALVMLGNTGGQYGTFLGDRLLPNNKDERVPLQDGDRIRLGEQQAWFIVKVHGS